jgi:tetratricopeptide (TPR) repeat protein
MLEDRRKRPVNHRLDSWKEIAAYFGRDERTVKRWEKGKGLPIHRLPGARGGVYAFTDELAQWMSNPDRKVAVPGDATEVQDQQRVSESLQEPESVAVTPQPAVETENGHAPYAALNRSKLIARALIGALIILTVASTLFLAWKRVLPTHSKVEVSKVQVKHQHVPVAAVQDLYLQGRYFWAKRTPADLTKALDYFQQSVAKDPDYALAYVGLADCYNLLREYAAMPEDEAYSKAIGAAQKAIELDPTLADAHNSLAFDLFFGTLDRAGAEREFQTALTLNPTCQLAHHWYATFLMTIGRSQEALKEIEAARQLDSSSTSILADKGLILYVAGRKDEAITLLKQIEKDEPTFLSSHRYLATIDLMTGDYDGYLKESKQTALLSGNDTERAIADAAAKGYRSGGPVSMLHAMLNEEQRWYSKGQFPAYRVAETYSLLGQKGQALAFLRLSRERHESAMAGIMVDPELNLLRDDPSYRQLAAEAGLS